MDLMAVREGKDKMYVERTGRLCYNCSTYYYSSLVEEVLEKMRVGPVDNTLYCRSASVAEIKVVRF